MIGVILQARMGSSRLPGKVLNKINGIPSLEFQIDRIKKAKKLNKIIVATSNNQQDNVIEKLCKKNDILFYRGSEQDVLKRYYECAKLYRLNTIVRLTADCPLIDPDIIDLIIEIFFKKKVDYCSNTLPLISSKWPDGSDVEVFSFSALKKANAENLKSIYREHVTHCFWDKKLKKYKSFQVSNKEDWSKFRFTIDYPEDYIVVKLIAEKLFKKYKNNFNTKDIVDYLKLNPDIRKINRKYINDFKILLKKKFI